MRENNTGVLEERQSGEKALRRLLKQEGIRQDEILAQAFSDFGLDTQYSDGALVLTKEYVLAAYLPSGARIERQFGGYGPVLHVPDGSRWQIVRYRTEELTELKVERYVTPEERCTASGTEKPLRSWRSVTPERVDFTGL